MLFMINRIWSLKAINKIELLLTFPSNHNRNTKINILMINNTTLDKSSYTHAHIIGNVEKCNRTHVTTALGFFSTANIRMGHLANWDALRAARTRGPRPAPTTNTTLQKTNSYMGIQTSKCDAVESLRRKAALIKIPHIEIKVQPR